LARHDKALNDKNVDAVMSTYSTDSNTVLLGTGVGERWLGPEAIRSAYTEIFKDYDPGTLVTTCDWKTGGTDEAGTTAWLAATCQCSDSMKGKKREYVLNVSAALQKQGSGFHFTMLHMSNVTGKPS
jgi:ketosteroid isomerase-like protein